MRKQMYLVFIFSLIGVVPLVILTFKFISDRKIASLIASAMFFTITIVHLYKKKKTEKEFQIKEKERQKISLEFFHRVWWLGYLQFLLFFALPIFLLRILNFEKDFSELELFGIKGSTFHYFSNYSYWILLLVNFLMVIKIKKPL